MEPTQPNYQPGLGTETPLQGPKRSRGKMLIILGVPIVIILVVVLIVLLKGKKADAPGNANTGDTSLYYNRAGYAHDDKIGDPLAITLTPKKEAQKLTSGIVIVPPCSVISPDDLKKQSLDLYPNEYGYPVRQNYVSNTGKALVYPDLNSMPLSAETISCSYGLKSSDPKQPQAVSVIVNQPFSVDETVVTNFLDTLKYTPQADMQGYKVFKQDSSKGSGTETRYMLRKNGDSIALNMTLEDDSKAEALLATAVTNLNSFASEPRGISQISYSSPTFTQKYAKSCDLVTNDDIKQLSGADASPLVREAWPTATGVADFSEVSSYKTKTNYLRNQCERFSNEPTYKMLASAHNHTLQIATTTFESEEAAAKGLQYYAVGEQNDTKTAQKGVGQEAYIYKKDKLNNLAFRQGRVVVELIYDYPTQTDSAVTDPAKYAEKLAPLGKKIATQLKDL